MKKKQHILLFWVGISIVLLFLILNNVLPGTALTVLEILYVLIPQLVFTLNLVKEKGDLRYTRRVLTILSVIFLLPLVVVCLPIQDFFAPTREVLFPLGLLAVTPIVVSISFYLWQRSELKDK